MKLQPNQPAPDFSITDVYGKTVKLSAYRGKKVFLSLNRFADCPICNVYFHDLQKDADFFRSKGLEIISVHESDREQMQQYVKDETIYGAMIPDKEDKIYDLYGAEKSIGKLLMGFLNGALSKAMKGMKLFKNKVPTDSEKGRVEADFLIEKDGTINTAHYGKYVGDRLQVADIKKFAVA